MKRQERYGLVMRQAIAARRGLLKGKSVLDIVVDGGLLLPGRPGKVGISTNNGTGAVSVEIERSTGQKSKQFLILEILLSKANISALDEYQ